jgi:GNAT superfamily N-acetyltransferase
MIIEILNKVTLNLHEKGVSQWTYPWVDDEIISDINKQRVYIMILDDTTSATFSIKDSSCVNADLIEANNNYIYRIAVLPEYQGKKLGLDIIKFALEYSKNTSKSLYLDCWAGNSNLRRFYSGAGFEFLGDVPEEDYFVSVFKA